jgi:putative flippase GtrA
MARTQTTTTRLHTLRTSSHSVALGVRYVLVGGTSAAIYVGLGLLLSGPVGMNIQLAIPISYAAALVVHFTLQRSFVWAHHEEYALEGRLQAGRYIALAGAQYAVTATATAVLPSVLGVSEQLVYAVTAVVAAGLSFLVLRFVVFHPG